MLPSLPHEELPVIARGIARLFNRLVGGFYPADFYDVWTEMEDYE